MLRGAEYDEQYTLFLTGQAVRPDWGEAVFPAAAVQALQQPRFDPLGLARALRETDVHPPLYFWLISAWRVLLGESLLMLRLFSVVCGLVSLVLVALLVRDHGGRPLTAMLLTLGSYGFVYTAGIGRGFALAIVLVLTGAVLLAGAGRSAAFRAGLALGAACGANYLAVFAALGLLVGRRVAVLAWVGLGMAPFLALDLLFFLAQRSARPDQFPPFDLLDSLVRLARYGVANLLGGLPLYVPSRLEAPVAAGLALLALGMVGLMAWAWWRAPYRRLGLVGAAVAPAVGLLVLGLLFDNTPIELRYLAFAVPLAMILLSLGLDAVPAWARRAALGVILLMQACSITGLALRRETMQPAREAARAAAALAGDGVVLLPAGKDGVGIVGAFAIEAPPALRLLVVRATDDPAAIRQRLGSARRVVAVAMAQDDAARAGIAVMAAALDHPCWRFSEAGVDSRAFEFLCGRAGE